ncbi:unnamed protein product [Arabidopsis arenosa]|uniref:Uncharacterized protein n=1 Tax=Arabidopsis arenosa TaxID=38785 RepID=A0A8S1ZVL1_ARAAE|nr:unnamed protein product [Arabidopsis arenosa]
MDMDLADDDEADSAPNLKIGEEKEIGKSGLKKKLVKEGEKWDTPENGDEVEAVTEELLSNSLLAKNLVRSLPIYVGVASLLAVLFNRTVSGIAPVADASRSTYHPRNEHFVVDFEQLQSQFNDMTIEEEDKLLDASFSKDGASIANRLSNAITCIKKREDKGSAFVAETTSMSMSEASDYFKE